MSNQLELDHNALKRKGALEVLLRFALENSTHCDGEHAVCAYESGASAKRALRDFLNSLEGREAFLLGMRLAGATFQQMGDVSGVDRVRAWQIFRKTVRRMRHSSRNSDIAKHTRFRKLDTAP